MSVDLSSLAEGIPLDPLPAPYVRDESVPHAPKRVHTLNEHTTKLAIRNALRYFPAHLHSLLGAEFAKELRDDGHVHMRRFTPQALGKYEMKAHPLDAYPARSRQCAAIQLMIMNNLDAAVAQFPHELITYGGNGAVFSNWAQYHLVMRFLSVMDDDQTLVIYSGHPVGLFPSHSDAPRVVLTNGMVIPNYSTPQHLNNMYALGVSQYGQMTAGSYCYIGPQGIVHGTTLTLLNAARKYLSRDGTKEIAGTVYVTSGLGGMSGAQPKAGVICGTICVVAEVDRRALDKRHGQGWVKEVAEDLDDCIGRIQRHRAAKTSTSIAYHGNIVDLWERLANEDELLVDLGSDQTSLHNPYNGGYYPVQLSFDEANDMMAADPAKFKALVQESLRRHVTAVNRLAQRGMRFWDYGNSFLLESRRAGAQILDPDRKDKDDETAFRYPSYVQDIMGDIFSLGFGPYRWVCTSGDPQDLATTDRIAAEVIETLQNSENIDPKVRAQFNDNLHWIREADSNEMVVGSQARILYVNSDGRIQIAERFNEAVASGELKAPVVLSRDHHDVSGTDSPFRETSNITDGSQFCADMAVHNFVGDSFRGATWVSLHNGGGVGWGEVMNGGFGLVLDGSADSARRARQMLHWDVNNGIARRSWDGNQNANDQIRRAMQQQPKLDITLGHFADEAVLDEACRVAQE